jgi:hypothetical protein
LVILRPARSSQCWVSVFMVVFLLGRTPPGVQGSRPRASPWALRSFNERWGENPSRGSKVAGPCAALRSVARQGPPGGEFAKLRVLKDERFCGCGCAVKGCGRSVGWRGWTVRRSAAMSMPPLSWVLTVTAESRGVALQMVSKWQPAARSGKWRLGRSPVAAVCRSLPPVAVRCRMGEVSSSPPSDTTFPQVRGLGIRRFVRIGHRRVETPRERHGSGAPGGDTRRRPNPNPCGEISDG